MRISDPKSTNRSAVRGASIELILPQAGLQDLAVEEILQRIVTGSPSERLAGLVSILARGTAETVPVLLKAAANEKSPYRREAIRLLGALGVEEAIGTMSNALQHSNPQLRREALLALHSIDVDGRSAARNVAKQFRKDPDDRVRVAAQLILSEASGSSRAFLSISISGAIVEALPRHRERAPMLARVMLQEVADGADRRWGTDEAGKVAALLERVVTSAGDTAHGRTLRDAALRVLVSGRETHRNQVIYRILEGSNQSLILAVLDLLRVHRSQARSDITDDNLADIVAKLLRNPDPQVRSDAMYALKSMGTSRSLQHLVSASPDPDKYNRRCWINMLPLKEGENVLLTALRDPDKNVRLDAIERLAGRREAMSMLLELCEDEIPYIRTAARKLLGDFGEVFRSMGAENRLLTIVDQMEPADAMTALSKIGGMEAMKRLKALFAAASDGDKEFCITSIALERPPGGSRFLEWVINDKRETADIRESAANSLYYLATPSSVVILNKLKENGEPFAAKLLANPPGSDAPVLIGRSWREVFRAPFFYLPGRSTEALQKYQWRFLQDLEHWPYSEGKQARREVVEDALFSRDPQLVGLAMRILNSEKNGR